MSNWLSREEAKAEALCIQPQVVVVACLVEVVGSHHRGDGGEEKEKKEQHPKDVFSLRRGAHLDLFWESRETVES